ncbi:MAG TPA: metallophosphoesterase [Polyangiaceae bacterium]
MRTSQVSAFLTALLLACAGPTKPHAVARPSTPPALHSERPVPSAPAPPTTPASKPFAFAVFGDNRSEDYHIRQPEVFLEILREIKKRGPRFIIGTGDHIQGYRYTEALLRREWVSYFEALKMVAPIPVYHTVGNHDLFDETSGRIWDQVMGPNHRHYTVEVEHSVFIFLDAETLESRVTGEQLQWLDAELEKHKEWDQRFICIHRPIFRPYINGKLEDWALTLDHEYKAEWEALVKVLSGRATAVFAGHYHMFDFDRRHGILQYITGGGGSGIGIGNDEPQKEFYHFLWVTVNGPELKVEVVRPDLSKVKEPVYDVSAPIVLEDFENDGTPIAWSLWNEGVRGEPAPSPPGGEGRAFAFHYDFKSYEWPQLFLGLEPVQNWHGAKEISFDVYVAKEGAPKRPLALRLRVGGRRVGYSSPDVTLKPGWNHLTFPFSKATWTWAQEDPHTKKETKKERVQLEVEPVLPVSTVDVMFSAYQRKEAGTVWFDNFRLD